MFLTNASNAGIKINMGQVIRYEKLDTTKIKFVQEGTDQIWTLPSEAVRDVVFTNLNTATAGTAIANT